MLLINRKQTALFVFVASIAKTCSMKAIDGRMPRVPKTGVMRSLILRVTDQLGDQPGNNAPKISDLIFGTHGLTLTGNQNSMVSDICLSYKIMQ